MLNACNALKRKIKLRESKAFSKSIATRIRGISLYLAYSNTSPIALTASKIVLPLTNAVLIKMDKYR